MRTLLEALALIWLILREQEDPDDGEERDAGRYLAMMGGGRIADVSADCHTSAAALASQERRTLPARRDVRNDMKEAVA